MANETTIGTHRLRIDGDLVLTRYIGVPEHHHVLEIHQHFDRVIAEHGRLYVINDMTRSGMPSTETRRWLVQWARQNPIAGVANFGASLPVRVLQGLVFRATALLGEQSVIIPVNCASEAEAYAWVAAQRRRHR